MFWRGTAVMTGPGWLAFTAWLVLDYRSAWLAAIACAPGAASGAGWYLERNSGIRRVLRYQGWVAVLLYAAAAFLVAGGLPARGWMFLDVVLFLLWVFSVALWAECRSDYVRDVAAWEGYATAAEIADRGRWLTKPGEAAWVKELAGALERIPAARFARLPGATPGGFLAVAGTRLLLVTELRVRAGTYSAFGMMRNASLAERLTGISAEAERWASSGKAEVLALAVVRPLEDGGAPGRIELRSDRVQGIALATMAESATRAGEFLLAGAYELDLDVLTSVCDRLAELQDS